MTGRRVQSLRAFTFSTDFDGSDGTSCPPESGAHSVSMSADELATLLERAREETAQLFHDSNAVTVARLEKTAESLQAALRHMLDLAEHLDRMKMEADDRSRARALMASACQLIVDGQGDLFQSAQPSSTDR